MSVKLLESVMDNSLHMPLHKLSASSTYVESIEGSVLVVPPSKEGQSPIIFGKAQRQRSTVTVRVQTQRPRNFSIMHNQHSV